MCESRLTISGTWAVLVVMSFVWGCRGSGPGGPPGDNLDSLAVFRAAFSEPEVCQACHPQHYLEWQMSMHAYAFIDPVFFALNKIGQERSNNSLDQFCIKCHSPVATLLKEFPPGSNPNDVSQLSGKGVQCDVCHLVQEFRPGGSITSFRLDNVRQGPIHDPEDNDFHESVFDPRFDQSAICSSCHNVDSPSGFVLEQTSGEWDDSPYSAMGISCQGCHMPRYVGKAATDGPIRDGIHRHTFVGVDIPLVDFPGSDEMVAAVDQLLKNAITMTVTAPTHIPENQEFVVKIDINNDRTGHRVPSGTIFERQMWLEVVVEDATGQVVFMSGGLDDNSDLQNHHSEYVASQALPVDSNLVLFKGTPYSNSEETLFFWEADSISSHTIAPFETKSFEYRIPNAGSAGPLQLRARLRFRSFPPYLLRTLDLEPLIDKLRIFDMADYSQSIILN